MTDHSKEPHGHQHEHRQQLEHAHKRPLHHDWRFWIVVLLMISAMGVYVFSMNGENFPWNTGHQPMPAAP